MRTCEICGEQKMPGWDVCPACGHPYDGVEPEWDDDEEGDEDD